MTKYSSGAGYLSPTTSEVANSMSVAPSSSPSFGFNPETISTVGTALGGVGNLIRGIRGGSGGGGGSSFFFDPSYQEETTDYIKNETELAQDRIRALAADFNLGGITPQEAFIRNEAERIGYLEPAAQRGFNLLYRDPLKYASLFADAADQVEPYIDKTLGKYSNLKRDDFMEVATNPSKYVEGIDPDVFDPQITKYEQAAARALAPGGMLDFSGSSMAMDPAGGNYSFGAMADRANNPNVQKLMKFATYAG